MMKRWRVVGGIALTFLLTLALNVGADQYTVKEQELAQVQSAQEQARELLASLEAQESALMAEIRRLEQDLARSEQDLAGVEEELQRTRDSITEVKRDVEESTILLKEDEAALKEITHRYNQRLVEIYMSGGTDIFDLLLEVEDPADLTLRMRLFSALLEQDAQLYKEVLTRKKAVEEERSLLVGRLERLHNEEKKLMDLESVASTRVAQVAKAKKARDSRLAEIVSTKGTQQQALAEYDQTAKKIQEWLKEYQTPALPTDAKGKVQMARPVSGQVTEEYGWRVHPIDKVKRFHEGLDFKAAEGTPITAAAGGRVVLAGWVGGYGNTVIIQHADNISTLYAHASALLVKVGELVDPGQTIAKVGSTGLSTGPHLHFEVRRSGQAVDPREYLDLGE